MVAAVAPADYAKLLFRTEPFSKMASARRFQLLSQARSVSFSLGDYIFKKEQPPTEVLLLLDGKVCMLGEMPGADEPVVLGEYGPGSCVGWDAALAGVSGVEAIAEGDVFGLLVAAPTFVEIARFDVALRDSFLCKPSRSEVWWAVLSELRRHDIPLSKADRVVEKIATVCKTRDWPEEDAVIKAKKNYIWVVSGGEGVVPGRLWDEPVGALWARLIGIPIDQFERAIGEQEVVHEAKSLPPPLPVMKPVAEASPVASIAAQAKTVSIPRPSLARRIAKGTVLLLIMLTAVIAGLCGWASRQPIIETVASDGRLMFSGDAHELTASVTGKLLESRIRPGMRVNKGAVLAIIQPPKDEAKAKILADTLARAKNQIDFCERVLAGNLGRMSDAPESIAGNVRDLSFLKSEYRVSNAINAGKPDAPGLTTEERARVNMHFDRLKADHAARIDVAQQDSSIKREDLADAEDALREAREELRVQTAAAGSLVAGRSDESKEEAASAQRALAVYKRVVTQRQDTVARIRKEIASIRVAPVVVPVAPTTNLEKLEAGIREAEKKIRLFSASMRILSVETEIAIEQLNADSAPRQIAAIHAGLVIEAESFAPDSPVNATTVLGKLVTRQAWGIECPEQAVHHMKPGQDFTILGTNPDGTIAKIGAQYAAALPGSSKNKARIQHDASNDDWRDGAAIRFEAKVVTGNLLERWLIRFNSFRQ